MLSSRKCAPIDDFIKAGILPLLIDFLTSKYNDKYDDLWLFINSYILFNILIFVEPISSMNVHGY